MHFAKSLYIFQEKVLTGNAAKAHLKSMDILVTPSAVGRGSTAFTVPEQELVTLAETKPSAQKGGQSMLKCILSKKKKVRKREPELLTVFSQKVKANLDKKSRNQVK